MKRRFYFALEILSLMAIIHKLATCSSCDFNFFWLPDFWTYRYSY